MIIGFTIAKNAIREKYPILEVIEQHVDLFDTHYIGVPYSEQDEDGTAKLISDFANKHDLSVNIVYLNWPGNAAWTEESLDKTLQKRLITWIQQNHYNYNKTTWLVKIDADEFFHEKDFDEIKSTMEFCIEAKIPNITVNYRQIVQSYNKYIWDPTHRVRHITIHSKKACFLGNDAMIFATPDAEEVYLEDVFLYHTGYVKDEQKLTRKIREHIVLNKSMYPDIEIPEDWKFSFPKHTKGAKCWPLGLSEIRGGLNEAEYFDIPNELLPKVLREKINH